MKHFKRKSLIVAAIVLSALSFSACGKSKDGKEVISKEAKKTDYIGDITETTITINKDGSIVEVAVEDYSGMKYDPEEIKKFIKGTVLSYNEADGAERVKFLQFQDNENIVKSAIKYDSFEAYNDFNGVSIGHGSYDADICNSIAEMEMEAAGEVVEEEKEEISVEDLAEAGLSAEDLEEGGVAEDAGSVQAGFRDAEGNSVTADAISSSYYMIKVDEATVVRVKSGTIKFVNNHATIINQTSAKALGDGIAIIIYTK